MAKIITPDKSTGQQHTAAEYNAMKASINAVYDFLFENGLIGQGVTLKPSVLPDAILSVNQFETLGDGTIGLIGFENIGTGGGTGPTKLATPTPTATAVSTTQINLNTAAIANADAYTWQRATNSSFTDAVNISTGSSPSYNNTGLTQNTVYYFRVKATSTNPNYTESNYAGTSAKTNATGATTPAAPTGFVVDDVANTGNWTNNPLFTSLSDYEQTLDGGLTATVATAKPLAVGDVAKAEGQVGIRVKGDVGTNRNPSAWLFNATPYTSTGGGTYIVERTFRFNLSSEYGSLPPNEAPFYNNFNPANSVIQSPNGFTSTSVVDDVNAASALVFKQKGAFAGATAEITTAQTGAGNTGVYPNTVVNTAWTLNGGTTASVEISGLDTSKFHQIYILMPSDTIGTTRGATIAGVTKNKTSATILGTFGTAGNGLDDPEFIVFNNITGSAVNIALNRVSGNFGSLVALIVIEQSNIAK